MKIEYKQHKKKQRISGGSIIESYSDNIIVVGDDATEFFYLDSNLSISTQTKFLNTQENHLAKKIKNDFEAGFIYNHTLYALGSGSKGTHRDCMLMVNLQNDSFNIIELPNFYNLLRQNISDLNIEGACMLDSDSLILFSRALAHTHNFAIITSVFSADNAEASLIIKKINTPAISNYPSGISGACELPNTPYILITLSAEKTEDTYNDGEIVGSALALLNKNTLEIERCVFLSNIHEKFECQKIESACVIKQNANIFTVLLIADNDDHTSTIFDIEICVD